MGPDEGQYDSRAGAAAYAPIVGAFGAIAVPAVVVVFTTSHKANSNYIALCTGFLIVGIFGSVLGAFGLGALGAELDATANIPPATMFVAVPVALAIECIFGAFEVLSRIYVPEAAPLFVVVTGAVCFFAVVFTTFVIADSPGFHPNSMSSTELAEWRSRQWLKDRHTANVVNNRIALICVWFPVVATVFRLTHVQFHLTIFQINLLIALLVCTSMAGAGASIMRSGHPESGNEQVSMKPYEAWGISIAVAVFSLITILVLP